MEHCDVFLGRDTHEYSDARTRHHVEEEDVELAHRRAQHPCALLAAEDVEHVLQDAKGCNEQVGQC